MRSLSYDIVPLSCVLSYMDLGVCVNSALSFSEHINNVFVKAKQRISLLLRSFLGKDLMLLTYAYAYAGLWCPW